jgi:hypothetical protein
MVWKRRFTKRENFLRAVEMNGPEWIPCRVNLLRQVWNKYRENLEDVVAGHPAIFGEFRRGSVDFDYLGVQYAGNLAMDEWKCTWSFVKDGITGQVVGHPIDSWGKLSKYRPPDYPLWGPPDGGCRPIPRSWHRVDETLRREREEGKLTVGGIPHGFMFMRLFYLRGYRNLMMDFAREDPRLPLLIDMVKETNLRLIDKWLELGPLDMIRFGDDLGTQERLPIRPELFRKYLLPAYSEMFGRIGEAGTHVYLHSDGHFLEIMDDLVDAGVTILNPQDRIHGLETLRDALKGRVCIDLDIDRQQLLPRGSRGDIERHIRNAVEVLGSPRGGLMMYAGIAEDVPLGNIEALCHSMEEFQRP